MFVLLLRRLRDWFVCLLPGVTQKSQQTAWKCYQRWAYDAKCQKLDILHHIYRNMHKIKKKQRRKPIFTHAMTRILNHSCTNARVYWWLWKQRKLIFDAFWFNFFNQEVKLLRLSISFLQQRRGTSRINPACFSLTD